MRTGRERRREVSSFLASRADYEILERIPGNFIENALPSFRNFAPVHEFEPEFAKLVHRHLRRLLAALAVSIADIGRYGTKRGLTACVTIKQDGVSDMIPPEACYLRWQESLHKLVNLVVPEIG